eukprot:358811-Chlamydomonas_euryale.AAC.6
MDGEVEHLREAKPEDMDGTFDKALVTAMRSTGISALAAHMQQQPCSFWAVCAHIQGIAHGCDRTM